MRDVAQPPRERLPRLRLPRQPLIVIISHSIRRTTVARMPRCVITEQLVPAGASRGPTTGWIYPAVPWPRFGGRSVSSTLSSGSVAKRLCEVSGLEGRGDPVEDEQQTAERRQPHAPPLPASEPDDIPAGNLAQPGQEEENEGSDDHAFVR